MSETTTAPAAPTAPALSFEDVDAAAVVTRKTETAVNPFTAKVAELVALMADGKPSRGSSFVVPDAEVGKYVRLVAAAGTAAGVSIRNKKEPAGNGNTRVSFAPIPKIHRPRTGETPVVPPVDVEKVAADMATAAANAAVPADKAKAARGK